MLIFSAEPLRQLMRENKMSYRAVANATGLHYSTVYLCAKEKRLPSGATLTKLIPFLLRHGYNPASLWRETNDSVQG